MRRNRSRPSRAYLLRCWQEANTAPEQPPGWRFSVEEVLRKGPRRGFDSPEALMAYLQAELAAASEDELPGGPMEGG
jgi:hypothetical protein